MHSYTHHKLPWQNSSSHVSVICLYGIHVVYTHTHTYMIGFHRETQPLIIKECMYVCMSTHMHAHLQLPLRNSTSDIDICTYVYMYTHTHTHTCSASITELNFPYFHHITCAIQRDQAPFVINQKRAHTPMFSFHPENQLPIFPESGSHSKRASALCDQRKLRNPAAETPQQSTVNHNQHHAYTPSRCCFPQ